MEVRGRDVFDALTTIGSVSLMSAPSGKKPVASTTNVRRFVGRVTPNLIYLNKVSGFAPEVLHDVLSTGAPVVAWFGDQRQGSYVCPVLDTLPADVRRRVFCVFNCRYRALTTPTR
jgi:hypothetical protein